MVVRHPNVLIIGSILVTMTVTQLTVRPVLSDKVIKCTGTVILAASIRRGFFDLDRWFILDAEIHRTSDKAHAVRAMMKIERHSFIRITGDRYTRAQCNRGELTSTARLLDHHPLCFILIRGNNDTRLSA